MELNYEFNLSEHYNIEEASYLNLRIGEDRLYVVKNMKNFLNALEEEQDIEFGKHFVFSPYKHKFKEEDKEVIDFLMLLYEHNKTNGMYNSDNIFKSKNVLLKPFAVKRFFNLMKGRSFNARIMDKNYNDIVIVEEAIPLDMDIQGNGENLSLVFNTNDLLLPLTSDGEYFFGFNQIYKLPENQRRKLAPLYNEIVVRGNGKLKVPDKYKESFISEVLPNIKNVVNLNIDDKVKEAIYNPELKLRFILINKEDIITGKIDFIYGDITINPFSSKENDFADKNKILLRDIEKERYILSLLEKVNLRLEMG